MYRRMVFNCLTDNNDDHCKNFSYLVRKDSNGKFIWHLALAYDLTLCTEGYNGQHATSVNSTGNPTFQVVFRKDSTLMGNIRALHPQIAPIIE